jgi:hypothetical protein
MPRKGNSGRGRAARRMAGAFLQMALAAGALPGLALAARVELVSRAPFRLAPDTVGQSFPSGLRPVDVEPGGGSTGYSSPLPSPLSADGRYFVHTSAAANLVPGQTDANGASDIFLYDRLLETTTLVSHVAG